MQLAVTKSKLPGILQIEIVLIDKEIVLHSLTHKHTKRKAHKEMGVKISERF